MVAGLRWEVAVSPLLGLIDKTYELLTSDPDIEVQPLMEHEPAWRKAILLIGIDHSHTMAQSNYKISSSAMNGLYGAGLAIQAHWLTPPIATEQVEQLSTAVTDLRQAILDATDIQADLRIFLLEQVNAMRVRIDRRQAAGDGPIEDLIAETIGSSAVHSGLWQCAMATSLKTKIVSVFIAYNAVIGGFNNTWDATGTALGHVDRAYSISHEVIEHILGDGPKAIEAPRAIELPDGESKTSESVESEASVEPPSDDDVIDAEVVPDEPAPE